jgi:hypothetical protein
MPHTVTPHRSRATVVVERQFKFEGADHSSPSAPPTQFVQTYASPLVGRQIGCSVPAAAVVTVERPIQRRSSRCEHEQPHRSHKKALKPKDARGYRPG